MRGKDCVGGQSEQTASCPHCKRVNPPTDIEGPTIMWLCCHGPSTPKPGWHWPDGKSGAVWVGIGKGDVERGLK